MNMSFIMFAKWRKLMTQKIDSSNHPMISRSDSANYRNIQKPLCPHSIVIRQHIQKCPTRKLALRYLDCRHPGLILCLHTVSANEGTPYKCNIFSHWLGHSSVWSGTGRKIWENLCNREMFKEMVSNFKRRMWDVIIYWFLNTISYTVSYAISS